MKKLALVLNAHSGTAREVGPDALLKTLEQAADWASLEVFDLDTSFEDTIRQACASSPDFIAIAGGDGTAAAVLNELARTQNPVPAIPLPCGTANLLPKRLYGTRTPDRILAELPDYDLCPLHAGVLQDRLFFVALMAGVPVRLGHAREALRPDDSGRNPLEAAKHLQQAAEAFWEDRMSLQIDGQPTHQLDDANALITIPGGVDAMVHGARPGEAALDTILTRSRDIGDSFGTVFSGLMETLIDGALSVEQARDTLTLTGPETLTVMLDGEPLTVDTPIHIRLHLNAARFAAPKDAQ